VDQDQDKAALAARFAGHHPETARRLRQRAESYSHRPLPDQWPTPVVSVRPAADQPDPPHEDGSPK
jgi:hypothetical protein